jgi:hypothetical protein
MVYLVLTLVFMSGLYIAAGVIALIRAGKAPSGRGLVFAGGVVLVVDGLITAVWNIWYRVFLYPEFMEAGVAMGPPRMPPWLFPTYLIGYHVLLVVAIGLFLLAVLSARGKQSVPADAHAVPQGYGPQPGQAPGQGQGYAGQQGGPPQGQRYAQQPFQQHQQAQQPQQPQQAQQPQRQHQPQQAQQSQQLQQRPQGGLSGPLQAQQPQQQPQGDLSGPQRPQQPQQPRPGNHQRPPEDGPSGPQQPRPPQD